ncbi:hypothetical protein [Vineibacter terrae]|nr:hypothetical protein [Vineibacter terrae]HEX2890865.1 hypothetical protein [Vineibacter terrae]
MARRFNKAEDWRITADYDEEPSVEGNDAASVRADALEFVGFCRRLLGG